MYGSREWENAGGQTLLHRIDVRTKLAALCCLMVCLVSIDSPRSLFLLFGSSLVLHVWAGSGRQRWQLLASLTLLSLWGAVASQGLFYSQAPRTVIACLAAADSWPLGLLTGGVFVYREGLEYGAVQGMRSASLLLLGLLLSWTSDARQVLRVLVSWRVPYTAAFMLLTALRFLPVVLQETASVLTAQQLRGFQPQRCWRWQGLRQALSQTLLPILARSLRRAETLAASVASRGFGRRQAVAAPLPWPWPERLAAGGFVSIAAAIVSLKALLVLRQYGTWQAAGWREVYDWLHCWL